MHTDPFLAETTGLHIRPDIAAALKESGIVSKHTFDVASFKPSLLGRIAALLAPKRAR
jgi:hypothetical protein